MTRVGGLLCVAVAFGCTAKHVEPEPEPDAPTSVVPPLVPTQPGDGLPQLAPHECDPLLDREPATVGSEPDEYLVEYVAEVSDQWLVVVKPHRSFRDVRVFFGRPDAMIERGFWSFGRPKGPGPTHVQFFVEDELAKATFPKWCDDPPVPVGTHYRTDCPGTLSLGADTLRFERRTTDDLAGKVFVCDTHRVRVSSRVARRKAEKHVDALPGSCRWKLATRQGTEFYDFNCTVGRDESEPKLVRVNLRTGNASLIER